MEEDPALDSAADDSAGEVVPAEDSAEEVGWAEEVGSADEVGATEDSAEEVGSADDDSAAEEMDELGSTTGGVVADAEDEASIVSMVRV